MASSKPSSPPLHPQATRFANIEWKNNVPYSSDYDDVYYSTTDGLKESEYNFQQQTSLKERWKELARRQTFTIIETGFGSGLNFFVTWKNWRNAKRTDSHLYYVSTELTPLKPQQLKKAINYWPQLTPFIKEFIHRYPPSTQGLHFRHFSNDNLTLLLLFGDAKEQLKTLTHPADTWFLDGFNPKKNPSLWDDGIFQQICRLSKANTNLATYTSSIEVQRKLAAINFQVEKRPGFGKKREMIVAIKRPEAMHAPNPQLKKHPKQSAPPKNRAPWFSSKTNQKVIEKSAMVIGAGIAGMYCADSLARRGWKVTVIEKNPHPTEEGSGNPWGALYTRFNTSPSPVNQFFQSSFSYTTDYMHTLQQQTPQQDFWDPCGLFQCAYSEKEERQLKAIIKSGYWPNTLLSYKTAEQASRLTGIKIDRPGLWVPKSGKVSPVKLCHHLLKKNPNINLQCNQNITELIQKKRAGLNHWQLLDNTSKVIHEAQVVILANAHAAKSFNQCNYLPISRIRGQLSYVPSTKASKLLRSIISYEGYLLPEDHNTTVNSTINPLASNNPAHVLGATFHPKDMEPNLRTKDHDQNLHQLSLVSEDLATEFKTTNPTDALQGRVGFRCQSPDYLPIVGPIPDFAQFISDYADLRVGKLNIDYPKGSFLPGLYCSVSHGSKGLISAPMSAEVIAAHIENTPPPLPRKLVHAIHPARFIIRNLKRKLC